MRHGTEFPVEISLSPVETVDGLLTAAAIRDVSTSKAAEAALHRQALLLVEIPQRVKDLLARHQLPHIGGQQVQQALLEGPQAHLGVAGARLLWWPRGVSCRLPEASHHVGPPLRYGMILLDAAPAILRVRGQPLIFRSADETLEYARLHGIGRWMVFGDPEGWWPIYTQAGPVNPPALPKQRIDISLH